MSSMDKVALVGNPNSGKTTLFNALTGENQKVGNYPGVTVERKTGNFRTPHGHKVEITDLPGCYSLSPNSPDEEVTRDALLGDIQGDDRPDIIICVADASNLERHLYLTLQCIDLGIPTVLALNKIDLAENAGIRLDVTQLAEELGIPVIACHASRGKGIVEVKQALRHPFPPVAKRSWSVSKDIEKAIHTLSSELSESHDHGAHALHLLADAAYLKATNLTIPAEWQHLAEKQISQLEANPEDAISKARFTRVKEICSVSARRQQAMELTASDKIDEYLLHPVFGWMIFTAIMFGMFWTIFSFAEIPMGWIEEGVGAFKGWVTPLIPEGDLRDLVGDGIIEGVGGVIIFLPQILLLFLFIGLLESTGYMARAAFIMDRFMSKVGLSGKAFIPLLSSYACAIPGIMATRTMESAKQRLLTILIAPWMSCTARLPVYFLLVGMLLADKPSWTQAALLAGIYLFGTLSAFLASWLLAPRVKGEEEPVHFLMELPSYQKPDLKYIAQQMGSRGYAFVRKAGTVILGLSILLWAMQTYPKPAEDSPAADNPALALEQSIMGSIGKTIEPVVEPLGYDWRTGTALVAAFAAREVFVSNLAISYSVDEEDDELESRLSDRLNNATWPDGRKVYTPLTVLSLLVFFVYALQCLPTTVVVRRETGSWKWALAQLGGMTAIAYIAALLVFQIGSLFVS
ncbi:ferrous iron transport protein B [Persicirhabdus sediminis]|uniref:Ferrous iron transport protein B n=2 Tax=Persicirhabdus sediminis TaxID=454144 RepID=A0A8J7MGY1_9BACT|nr:ferrous iron transport protein B [Persicirhabdus sediminis]